MVPLSIRIFVFMPPQVEVLKSRDIMILQSARALAVSGQIKKPCILKPSLANRAQLVSYNPRIREAPEPLPSTRIAGEPQPLLNFDLSLLIGCLLK